MAAPSQKRSLGALFLVLGFAFAGVAFASAAADGGSAATRWAIVVVAGVIAVWFFGLSARHLRPPRHR